MSDIPAEAEPKADREERRAAAALKLAARAKRLLRQVAKGEAHRWVLSIDRPEATPEELAEMLERTAAHIRLLKDTKGSVLDADGKRVGDFRLL